jgi:hypothetical protein
MSDGDEPDVGILAQSENATVLVSDDGYIYVQVGITIQRFDFELLQEYVGLLNKALATLRPPAHKPAPANPLGFKVIPGGGDEP